MREGERVALSVARALRETLNVDCRVPGRVCEAREEGEAEELLEALPAAAVSAWLLGVAVTVPSAGVRVATAVA